MSPDLTHNAKKWNKFLLLKWHYPLNLDDPPGYIALLEMEANKQDKLICICEIIIKK